MTSTLPTAALLACWLGAWLRGEAALDDLLDHLGARPHVLTGLPGTAGAQPLALGLGDLRSNGLTSVSAALPAPGDPLGLAGPAAFNATALEHGEAVLLGGVGLGAVPVVVGAAVEWRCAVAAEPAWLDHGEASVALRHTLLEVTQRLVELDVASWQPEIPDALANLRHRADPPLPSSYDGRRRETVDRALLCADIVRLAREAPTGALTASDLEARRTALADLDRAARRALVAACR